MVYKKYIIKNGKSYGPYIYHSKRVDGKVVSEYIGYENKTNYKNIFFIILGFVFVLILIYLMAFFGNKLTGLTGHVSLGIDANYVAGEPLQGEMRLALKQGELIPASSKIVFETSNRSYEFALSDIISGEKSTGNYYIQGKEISGNGEGYGIEGTKTIYPDVPFTLNILTQASSSEETPETIPEENPNEIPQEQTPETPITETSTEETLSETPTTEETIPATEQTPETPTTTETTPEQSNGITGNIISRLLKGVGNFFLGLTGTGQVSLEIQNEITGITSADKPFSYELSEGQSVELASSSHDVNVKTDNNIISVTTDYSKQENGFGEEYLGNEQKILTIDLSSLSLILPEGDMNIKIVYNDADIISLDTTLTNGESVGINETEIENISIVNETIINGTIISNYSLSESEIAILLDKLGNLSVQTTKAELINGRIVVRFEIGKYWVEYSYNSDLSESALNYSIEKDRIKWLKDLTAKFSEKQEEAEQVEGLLGSYDVSNSSQREQQNGNIAEIAENESIIAENESLNESVSNETA